MNTPAIVHAPAETTVRVSLPKVTIAMILCGIVSAAGIGAASAASAATPEQDVAERGREIHDRRACSRIAERARCTVKSSAPPSRCARQNPDSRIPSEAVRQCRAQSIARAVMKINNSKLAAIHDSASRNG